jgi:hypothetical protein
VCVARTRKDSRNNIAAAQWVGLRQWLHLMDRRKWQRLTGLRRIKVMGHPRVSRTGDLQRKA